MERNEILLVILLFMLGQQYDSGEQGIFQNSR